MALPPITLVDWPKTHRIINSRFPPIDLFEDIADPADWSLLASAESKSNPRLHKNIGNLGLVPPERCLNGEGASWVMAPFVHASPSRPGRFHDGNLGAYYAGDRFEVALYETIHHHEKFMRSTQEPKASTTFRELIGSVRGELHDIRDGNYSQCLAPASYKASHTLAAELRTKGSNGIVYPSVRYPDGSAIAAFYPDVVALPAQGRHLRYHWNGTRVSHITDLTSGERFEVIP